MLLIGDIHGKYESYCKILRDTKAKESVQLGDYGKGFAGYKDDAHDLDMTQFSGSHRYIRGNHDNPTTCKADPRYIDDGHFDEERSIIYIGGALSIDKEWRIPGQSWWEDEELSYDALGHMINRYEELKPDIMLTHECPEAVVPHLFDWYQKEMFKSRTRQAFETMFEIHKPKLWVFGHWHASRKKNILGTEFVCLNELETMELSI